jgi:TonB-dependent SusC/RagA subfamily outer membrane receptor
MYYFFQVILCSGLLMGYYWLLLRNKRFHQYNRFYLLAVAFLSWIVPLIKIRWTHNVIGPDQQVARLLSVVADGNTQIEEIVKGRGSALSWGAVVTAVYILVAAVLLTGIIRALFRLYRLLQVNSCKTVGDIYLIFTQAKGTPFSFFRYIFWNDEIDIRSNSGKQILEHELTHVKEKHSYDKLFIQLMLVAGWFNPFFWLLKKEMEMIHEFIADKKAVADGDTASLADMLLTTVFPQQQYRLTHPFFFSPVKRRLQMLTNTSHPRFTYIRRLIVLPLLAAMVILFSFRNKEFGRTNLSLATVVDHVIDNPTASLMIDHVDRLLLKPVNGSRDSVRLFADTIMVCDGNGLIQKAYGNITIADKGESGLLGEALIVVNGTKADHTILETIHPDDIDRIDILKDRAAVDIYGDAGKNGVVLITTKNQSDPANTSSLTSYSQKGEDVTLPANRVSEVTIAAPGFKKADPIVISPKYNSPDWSVRAAWVKEDGKVKETFNNPTKNEIKLSAEDYAITRIQYPGSQPEKTSPAEMETNQEQDPAQFPGGEIAWKKYLERNLNR